MPLTPAMVESGMKIARRVARKMSRFAPHHAEEVYATALEAVVKAGESYDPARGPWEPWAAMYATEYASRESTKGKSLVTTNHDRPDKRAFVVDAALVATDEETGETVILDLPDDEQAEERATLRHDLSALAEAAEGIVAAMPPKHRPVAKALWEMRWMGDATHAEVASACDVSRATVLKIENTFRAALREAYGE